MRPEPDQLVVEITIEQLTRLRDDAKREVTRLTRLLRAERKKLARLQAK